MVNQIRDWKERIRIMLCTWVDFLIPPDPNDPTDPANKDDIDWGHMHEKVRG